ncbi:unnamed protein product [Vicia faba]|uniref:Uncharacterized protein n=1 Tax=Vicia faba TaxID=3906 RepID=A0AAV1AS22_VICFA|nr:unnamed protein product [Vicia faba]
MKDGADLSFDAETVAGGGGLSGADLFAAGVGGVGRRGLRGGFGAAYSMDDFEARFGLICRVGLLAIVLTFCGVYFEAIMFGCEAWQSGKSSKEKLQAQNLVSYSFRS